MRFSALAKSSNVKALNKFAGVAAALMILPVAVACSSEPTADTSADLTSELPIEGIEGIENEAAETTLPSDIAADDTTDIAADSTEDITATDDSQSIVDVASANGSFNTLVAAVEAAGLEETLNAEGPYTVFAPTDEAFAELPDGMVEKLVQPENQDALGQILAYHVVAGAVPSTDIESGAIGTVEGSDMAVTVDPAEGVVINGEANVVQPDVTADNGVIHVVDSVLLPPTFDPTALL